MKITVLTDNISCADLKGEWGLSLFIEYNGKRFLLDTGASDAFIGNAQKLGIDIASVDYAILSHAHYDHTRGLPAFLEANSTAPVFLSPNAAENCYAGLSFLGKYIGIPRGVTEKFAHRIVRPAGVYRIDGSESPIPTGAPISASEHTSTAGTPTTEGVYLVPHSTDGLARLGKRNHLYIRKGLRLIPDDFSHEQTLVFKTPEGLVLLNSCSHSGPEVVVAEVLKAFPGETIAAYVGGLHLFRLTDQEVESVSQKLAACGIKRIYTGHCTGQKAYDILKERFADSIGQFHCGMQIEL